METMKIMDNPGFKAACRSTGYMLENADFSSAALGGSTLCGDEDHRHLVLNQARFKSTDLRLAQGLDWKLKGGAFTACQCAGTKFQGCEFVDVSFKDVSYFDADAPVKPAMFINSQLLYADFEGERLSYVVFNRLLK